MAVSDISDLAVKVTASAVPSPAGENKSKEEVVLKGIPAVLLPTCVQVYPDDPLKSKLITYEDFINSLKLNEVDEQIKEEKIEYFLPQNTFYFSRGKNIINICCYYPETKRYITYLSNKAERVVPNIIISLSLKERKEENVVFPWAVMDIRYLCTKIPLAELNRKFYTTPESGMGLLPFTNVYHDARLCFGNNVKPGPFKLPDLRGLHGYYEVLFNAPFNNDLGLAGVGNGYRRDIPAWYGFLAKLAKENKSFPYEELILN